MQGNRRPTNIHTYLFIVLCIILAIAASFGTFARRAASPPDESAWAQR